MIRIGILGESESLCRDLGRRLRNVVVQDHWHSCDAVALLGAADKKAPPINALLTAGKHVLAAISDEIDASSLSAAHALAKESNVRLALVNPDRYRPSLQLIRQQLDARKLGTPGLIRLHRWGPGSLLCDLDLIHWYFGKSPSRVYAVGSDQGVQIHLGFANGKIALYGHLHQRPIQKYSYLSIIGSSGAAYADDHHNAQLVFAGEDTRAVWANDTIPQWTAATQAFVDALARHDSNQAKNATGSESCSTEAWHDVFSVRDAVQRSLSTRQAAVLERMA